MEIASSALRTCKAVSSALEYTATVSSPSSLHARITRKAISPRFATSTRRISPRRKRSRCRRDSGVDGADAAAGVFNGSAGCSDNLKSIGSVTVDAHALRVDGNRRSVESLQDSFCEPAPYLPVRHFHVGLVLGSLKYERPVRTVVEI